MIVPGERLRYRNIGSLQLDEVISAAGLIEDAQALVEGSLKESLKVYNQMKARGMGLESCLTLISATLRTIEENEGYNFFLQLYGLVKYPLTDKIEDNKKLVDIFPNIHQLGMPVLPWLSSSGFWLFDKETEIRLCKPGTHQVNQDDFLGNVKLMSQIDNVVIQNLLNPNYNERKNHIFKLFLNQMIAEHLDAGGVRSYPVIESIDLKTKKVIGYEDSSKLQSKNGAIELKKHIIDLFKTIYCETKNEIIAQKIMPDEDIIELPVWNVLLDKANSLRRSLQEIKNEFPDIISKLKVEQKHYLFQEIRNFLNLNKLNETVIPSRSDIELFSGGKGLIKRISQTMGMPQAKVDYTPWVIKVLEDEKDIKLKELKSEAEDSIEKSLQGSGNKPGNLIMEVVDLDKLEG